MKRVANQVAVVVVLLGIMLGLDQFKTTSVDGSDPLTLAAIGFVVLAAYTLAELGSMLTLPKVTGFILAGIALGPYAGNVLSSHVVTEMRMFNDLALGLIATSAGLELDGKAIIRKWKSLSATVGLKVLLLPLTVGGVFFGLQTMFGILELGGTSGDLALALIFSALAVGTSPAIALAVLSETGAKGSLSDLTLGLAVLKDAVVVVCLAVAVAVALSLNDPDASLGPDVFIQVGKHLGEEVLLGAALAVFLILYMRFIGVEMLLFVAAMILVVTRVTDALHLQPLLVFIVAGFIVRNFTKYEHTLLHPLEVVALPVFVVFFTNAGASVNLEATLQILPFAVALCLARAGTFWVAGRFGAAAGKEPQVVQKAAWLAYLPQAGVTLGLVGIAASQVPDFATPILNTGMAVVAINLLAGPITLRLALKSAGEIPEPARETIEDAAGASQTQPELVSSDEVETAPERPTLSTPELQSVVDGIDRALTARMDDFIVAHLEPWSGTVRRAIEAALPEDDELDETSLTHLLDVARDSAVRLPGRRRAELFRGVYDEFRQELSALPFEIDAPIEAYHYAPKPTDGGWLRFRRRLSRIGDRLTGRKRRRIPVRMGSRMALEPRLSEVVRDGLSVWCRTEAAVLAELRHVVEGNRGVAEIRSGIDSLLSRWVDRMRADFDRGLVQGLRDLADLFETADTPELPVKEVRFSKVEPLVTRTLAELDRRGKRWEVPLTAAVNTVVTVTRVEVLRRRTQSLLGRGFLRPLSELLESILPEIEATQQRLEEIRERLGDFETLDKDALTSLLSDCRKAFPQDSHVRIKKLRAEFKDEVSESRITSSLHDLVGELPESAKVLGGGTAIQFAKAVDDVQVVETPLRRVCEEALLVDLLPIVGDRLRETLSLVTVINSQIREHVSVAIFALDTAVKGEAASDTDARALIEDGLERSIRRIEEFSSTLERIRHETPVAVKEGLGDAFGVIHAGVSRGRSEKKARRARGKGARRVVVSGFRKVLDALGRLRNWVSSGVRRLQASDFSQELQARAGRTRLDAAGLRDLLYAEVRGPDQGVLPPIYERLFTLEPIRDRRLFAVRKNELKILTKEEQAFVEQGSDGVLVVGERGSGRTSLLNVAQLDFRCSRILRMSREQGRIGGVLGALASELQVEMRQGAVRNELQKEPTAIVIDDFEEWFTPDAAGLTELERVLDLVLNTRTVAFWVVAISAGALTLLDPLLAVRQAFGRVITLPPLDADGIARVIESRNRVSGLQIHYPRDRWARLMGERRADTARTSYYRNLARTSDGNLRAAVRAWYRDVVPGRDDTVEPILRSNVLGSTRFLARIHPHAVAILVQAARFGTLDTARLGSTLGLDRAEVNRHLSFLQAAGLLGPRPGFGAGLRIVPEVQPTLTRALVEAGALKRGE